MYITIHRTLRPWNLWVKSLKNFSSHFPTYVQGQNPDDDKRSREYFYYIDHQGMLFLDDSKMKNFTSCFKDKAFLRFFFRRLKFNTLTRYPEFPFLSPCGRERNYVRCDDLPVVFTHLIDGNSDSDDSTEYLSYAHAGNELLTPFEPEKLCMVPETGRVYHPAPEKVGGVGLVRSKLSIQLSTHFIFDLGEDKPPTQFLWKNQNIQLTQEMVSVLEGLSHVRKYSLGINAEASCS